MTGRERMQRIRRHVIGIANTRLQLFMSGTLGYLPCWSDEIDDLIAMELDGLTNPVRLGLWFWE